MALRYSQKCHWGHGNVVNVSPHSSVGQNLWIQGLSSQAKVPNTASAINAWYSEVRNFNFASNSTYECSDPHQCGHYTQVTYILNQIFRGFLKNKTLLIDLKRFSIYPVNGMEPHTPPILVPAFGLLFSSIRFSRTFE